MSRNKKTSKKLLWVCNLLIAVGTQVRATGLRVDEQFINKPITRVPASPVKNPSNISKSCLAACFPNQSGSKFSRKQDFVPSQQVKEVIDVLLIGRPELSGELSRAKKFSEGLAELLLTLKSEEDRVNRIIVENPDVVTQLHRLATSLGNLTRKLEASCLSGAKTALEYRDAVNKLQGRIEALLMFSVPYCTDRRFRCSIYHTDRRFRCSIYQGKELETELENLPHLLSHWKHLTQQIYETPALVNMLDLTDLIELVLQGIRSENGIAYHLNAPQQDIQDGIVYELNAPK